VKEMQIEEVLTAPQSPWQNPFAERLIGSVGRECLNHVLVLGERHLRRILTRYLAYYHQGAPISRSTRTHPTPGLSSSRRRARSWRFPKSAACTTATSAGPRSPRARPASARNHDRAHAADRSPPLRSDLRRTVTGGSTTSRRQRPLPQPPVTQPEPVRRLRRFAKRLGRGYGEGQVYLKDVWPTSRRSR
jgi:Integrase core domain